jgi:hypothetical protein
MSASKDTRINTALPSHPKTKKLLRTLGPAGGWYLVRLLLWATENRSNGDLSGLTDDDIELAIDWPGEAGALVAQLASVGFIDGQECSRQIHDWLEHNSWAAGASERSLKGRWNAAKRHHGEAGADRLVPAYRVARIADSNAASNAPALQLVPPSNAPSPSPSPSPKAEKQKNDDSPDGSRLPADWVLPQAWRAWAVVERRDLDLDREAADFADYWHAMPGAKGRKSNWQATWRRWVRNAHLRPTRAISNDLAPMPRLQA